MAKLCVLERACWCRCRVLLQGAAAGCRCRVLLGVVCAFWSGHVGAAAGCRCRVLLQGAAAGCCLEWFVRFGLGMLVLLLEGGAVKRAFALWRLLTAVAGCRCKVLLSECGFCFGVDWNRVYRREPQPCFPNFPPVKPQRDCAANFASEFTAQPAPEDLRGFEGDAASNPGIKALYVEGFSEVSNP
eukprot:s2461_g9.t1